MLNRSGLNDIALTFDIDWAPDFAVWHLRKKLEAAGVSATLFVTHATDALEGIDESRLEKGLHPHLPDRLDLDAALAKVQPLAPQAVGIRFHRLIQSTPLMGALGQKGFLYDASMLVPYQSHLRPFVFPAPLVRIPYPWEDDVHAALGRPFTLDAMELDTPGLKIMDFHPIHLFLNTEKLDRYEQAKAAGFTLEACTALRNPGPGPDTLLDDLLRLIAREHIRTYRLRDLADAVVRGEVDHGG